MQGFKYKVFRAALNTLYFSGAYRALRPLMGGVGAILMLHHVRPSRPDRFQPNHLLEVTPRFFETRDPAAAPLQGRSRSRSTKCTGG